MTSKLTREAATDSELQMLIDSHENGTAMFVRAEVYYLMAKELQERRKAAMESEPVAYMLLDDDDVEYNAVNEFSCGRRGGIPLYRHPQPAQVVPEKATVGEMPFLGTSEGAYVRGWNDCRAAMLNEGKS